MTEKLEGTVNEIIYENKENGYAVCEINVNGSLCTAVGIMPQIAVGETLKMTGEWTTHATYGEQFKVQTAEHAAPDNEEQILLYLSSGIIRGIGPATALKIVGKFGADSLNIIRDSPYTLSTIKGISNTKALEIQHSYLEKQAMQEIIMFLSPYGVTPEFAVKVFEKFGALAVTMIKKTPYCLCKIDGIGFKTADKIAMKMGIELNDPERLQNGIKYILTEYAQSGNTYIWQDEVVRLGNSMLGAETVLVENAVFALYMSGEIIRDEVRDKVVFALPYLYNAEVSVARRLVTLAGVRGEFKRSDCDRTIKKVEAESGYILSSEQKEACLSAMENGAAVITGGPGTGKTTIIRTIISLAENMGLSVDLCAPTGRAAKRMSEACGREAKTVHRLLELNYTGDMGQPVFGRDESRPLEGDIIIVDEMSMVDIILMNALLKAMKSGARIVMTGDADQLPSVGAGDVLRDIIASEVLPTYRLTEIYRQAEESLIVLNAHRINRGERPETEDKDRDFFFIKRDNTEDILSVLTDVYSNRLPKAYGFNPVTDIQVITPARKSQLGVQELNKRLQQVLNSDGGNTKTVGDTVLREGDKIMQTRNNYDIEWVDDREIRGSGAFNGDMGIIKKIDNIEKTVEVLFDGTRKIIYSFDQLDNIELAYAVTVHKSQGSEFDAVIIPLFRVAPQLISRNILYTAVTRAKKLVVLVGREDVMYQMITNDRGSQRFSGLCSKIEKLTNA